jgi:hypothetical protein
VTPHQPGKRCLVAMRDEAFQELPIAAVALELPRDQTAARLFMHAIILGHPVRCAGATE